MVARHAAEPLPGLAGRQTLNGTTDEDGAQAAPLTQNTIRTPACALP